jgi:hypothetical protein
MVCVNASAAIRQRPRAPEGVTEARRGLAASTCNAIPKHVWWAVWCLFLLGCHCLTKRRPNRLSNFENVRGGVSHARDGSAAGLAPLCVCVTAFASVQALAGGGERFAVRSWEVGWGVRV